MKKSRTKSPISTPPRPPSRTPGGGGAQSRRNMPAKQRTRR